MSLKRKPPAGNVRRVLALGNNSRGTVTNKVGRIVQFESFAERSLLLRLDRDPSVQDYGSQPETFHRLGQQGQKETYTPDFIVWRVGEIVEIHEITRSERRQQKQSIAREILAHDICHERGWVYIVHTEKDLPQGYELSNLMSLFRYRPMGYRDEAAVTIFHTVLAESDCIKACSLIETATEFSQIPQPVLSACLCHLLWHSELKTNWQQAIFSSTQFASSTMVWFGGGTDEAAH